MTWCLGVDPSKRRTGWALIRTHPFTVKSGSFGRFEGQDVEIYTAAFFELGKLLKHTIPKDDVDRVFLIERPMYQIATRKITDHTGTYNGPAGNPKDQCVLHGLVSAYSCAAALMKFRPHETGVVTPAEWRKSFFGKGFKPSSDKNGKAMWKSEVTDWLKRDGINVSNHDEAEATAIAYVLSSRLRMFA